MTTKHLAVDKTRWNGKECPPGTILEIADGEPQPRGPEWVLVPYGGTLEVSPEEMLPAGPEPTPFYAFDRAAGKRVRIMVQRGLAVAAVFIADPVPAPPRPDYVPLAASSGFGVLRWGRQPDFAPAVPPAAPSPPPTSVGWDSLRGTLSSEARLEADLAESRRANAEFERIVREAREDEARKEAQAAADLPARLLAGKAEDERRHLVQEELARAPQTPPKSERADPAADEEPAQAAGGLAEDLARALLSEEA